MFDMGKKDFYILMCGGIIWEKKFFILLELVLYNFDGG